MVRHEFQGTEIRGRLEFIRFQMRELGWLSLRRDDISIAQHLLLKADTSMRSGSKFGERRLSNPT